jgi:quinolinate synthase
VVIEAEILHGMHERAPPKTLIPAPPPANCACNECPFMRPNTLEKVHLALRDLEPRLEMPEELRARSNPDRPHARFELTLSGSPATHGRAIACF